MVGYLSMKKRIMFVDDEPDQLYSFEQVLNDSDDDFEFIGVRSGQECVKELEQNALPDIIFLDIMMVEMSGWEVYDKLRTNPVWADIPIVFLTARTDRIAENAGDFLGDGFLEKPVESKDLFECIEQVMSEE